LIKSRIILDEQCNERDNFQRIRDIILSLQGICREYKVVRCYLEEPPPTVYQQKAPMHILMARAKSTAQVMAACHAILAAIYHENKIQCQTFWPSDWQVNAQRRKQNSKEWSLHNANIILKEQGLPATLHTEADENIADAIVFGYMILQKFESESIEFN